MANCYITRWYVRIPIASHTSDIFWLLSCHLCFGCVVHELLKPLYRLYTELAGSSHSSRICLLFLAGSSEDSSGSVARKLWRPTLAPHSKEKVFSWDTLCQRAHRKDRLWTSLNFDRFRWFRWFRFSRQYCLDVRSSRWTWGRLHGAAGGPSIAGLCWAVFHGFSAWHGLTCRWILPKCCSWPICCIDFAEYGHFCIEYIKL